MKRERRFTTQPLKLVKRTSADDPANSEITGYALVYNSISENLGVPGWFDWYEMIAPGAFDASLENIRSGLGGEDCVALYNHDVNYLLGRASAGTLALTDDAQGLGYSITPPDTQYARDVVENVRLGNIRGSSFAMTVETEDYRMVSGKEVRIIQQARLYDVSPVVYPAYPATNGLVSTRSDDMSTKDYAEMLERRKIIVQVPELPEEFSTRERKLRMIELDA